MQPSRLQELLDKQDITEVVYQIARATDRGDVELYASGFHEDGTDYHGLSNGPVKNILGVLGKTALLVTQHAIHNVLVELDGDSARVESYFCSFHQGREENGTLRDETIRGRYLDVFERRDGTSWKIAQRIVVWDWSQVEPAGDSWFDLMRQRPGADDRYIFSRRDKEDLVYSFQLPVDFE